MKTEVILTRPFMGSTVRQRSKNGFFNATDLVKIANIKRRELGLSIFNLSQFLKTKSTTEFIEELQKENERVLIKSRGAKAQTWVHPLLFIDIALAINPKFKIEVYKWLYDELLKYRNDSGDSYTKMAGVLYDRYSDKTRFHKFITNVAKYIKDKCEVKDWNDTTQEKLFLRTKIHENIYLLCSCLKDPSYAVKMGVNKAIEDNKNLLN